MHGKKKTILNIIFLLVIFVITMYLIFAGKDLKELAIYIKTADVRYWYAAIMCVLIYIFAESSIIYYMMKTIGQKVRMTHCMLYSFVGFFFSCVTPGATGGQPMQLYYMKKDKIPISVGSLVLLIVTITYKLVLVLVGCFVFIFRPGNLWDLLQPVIGWCILGMVLNIACIVFMLMLVFCPEFAKKIVYKCLRFLKKLHILKNSEKLEKRLDSSMVKYKEVSVYFNENINVIINVFLITFVQRILLFFVTYLTCCSFGLMNVSAFDSTVLQGMIAAAVDMLPLPGGMGISEKLFMDIFNPVFADKTLAVMIVSRGLSYYTELLISSFFTIVANFKIGGKKHDRVL